MFYDLAIIGGGPAGYTAAEKAAKNGLKTILFEKNALGGVCLNEGCIPTKTLLYSAKVLQSARESSKYAVSCENVSADLSKIISRKNKVVRKLTAGIRMKMQEAGVEVIAGEAALSGRADKGIRIICNEQAFLAKKLLLCTGSESITPPIPGLASSGYWTSREALDCKDLPASLCIIGGGVIGMEFASFFNTLGTEVTVVEMQDEILGGMDRELSAMLRNEYTKKGIRFFLETKVTTVNGQEITVEKAGEESVITAGNILLSVGRRPVLSGLGLENFSLERFGSGLKVNRQMQTSDPDIYACGDITGFSLLAHTAVREAEVAIDHLLNKKEIFMDYRAVPGVVYTNPEIAGVGKAEEQLQAENISYSIKKLPLSFAGRFVAENEMGTGVCKVLLSENEEILGVHILGNPASEFIIVAGIAIAQGMKAHQLGEMIFPHPTVGEIIKEAVLCN